MKVEPSPPQAATAEKPGLFALLFGTRAPVERPTYLRVGVVLMLLKYAIDAGIIFATTGHVWMPHEYLSPAVSTRSSILGGGNEWALAAMVVITLPFLWIGLSMSLRRAVDAGVSATVALLFLVPGINYGLMCVLAMMPSAPPREQAAAGVHLHPRGKITAALYGILAGLGLGIGVALFSTLVLREYGEVLFMVTPGLIGAFAGWFFNQDEDRGLRATLGVASLAVTIVGTAMLLFAIEGIICLVMALPLAIGLGVIGGALGRQMAHFTRVAAGHVLVIFALTPLLGAVEAALPAPLVEREVATSVVIDAPPAAVWPNVVGFAELDAPPSLIFDLGVAYPLRARIDGEGVGAVRHCEFTTGAFVEPITAWEPHQRLAFDVAEQPAPMFEWSPYAHVHPPHLDGYLRSRRGEFRLIDLGDGRTRLEGSTWYTLDLAPSPYWAFQSDALIHGIHTRVLDHIKGLSERGHVSVPGALDDRPLGG